MKARWKDECGHTRPRDRFLGTIDVNGRKLDVYVYQDNALGAPVADMHVCLRYGNRCEQYASPGNVGRLITQCESEPQNMLPEYLAALPLLKNWQVSP